FRLQLINVTADRIRLLHELNELHTPGEVIARLGAIPDPTPEGPDPPKPHDAPHPQPPAPPNPPPLNNDNGRQSGQAPAPHGGRRPAERAGLLLPLGTVEPAGAGEQVVLPGRLARRGPRHPPAGQERQGGAEPPGAGGPRHDGALVAERGGAAGPAARGPAGE